MHSKMITLYHFWLSPGCRKVRLLMGEKKLDFNLHLEKTWRRDPDFLALNPMGEVPVIVDEDGTRVCGSQVICEYLDEMYGDQPLIGVGAVERAETRRLIDWFDRKFNDEVINNLVDEKILKRFLQMGEPNSGAIRAGHKNVRTHLAYIDWLVERRKWLAGDDLTLADLTAAA
ncbi:MAG: glutathione S-transferase family protein, partial [Alphaproteobacteria bacterium]|nr:glutathione S-transferase family protein [Alphaproteobacteria bacterium]